MPGLKSVKNTPGAEHRNQSGKWFCVLKEGSAHTSRQVCLVIPQMILIFESTPLKGELAWRFEVVWKRRPAQNLNFGLSVLYYESEEVDCGEHRTTNLFLPESAESGSSK